MGKISRLAQRRVNLDITTSQDLAAFMRGSRETWSGANVSVKEAEKVSAWYAGLRNTAEDLGKLPFIVYWKGDDRRRAENSPWWTVVHDRASRGWSSQAFREHMTYWAAHDGNSFAAILPSKLQTVELVPFQRGKVRPEMLDDGTMVYHLEGKATPTPARHIFHLRGFSIGRDGGANLFGMSREEIGLSLALDRHAGTFFKNGGQIGGVVEHPAEMSATAYEHLDRSLNEGDFNGENAHRWLIVEEGAAAKPFAADNEKAQLLEGREFQVEEHARRLRIPPHKVGSLRRSTFSNIEHQSIEYVQDTLLPWAIRWEHAYNQQVISDTNVYAELLFESLLRGDSKTRGDVYSLAIQNGWMAQNEARRRENLPPLPGGDVLLTPLNTATPADREAKLVMTKAQSAKLLVTAGFNPADVLETVGLPEMGYVGAQSATGPTPSDSTAEDLQLAGV